MSLEDLVELIWGSLSLVEKGLVLFTLVVYVLFAIYSPSTRQKTFESVVLGANSLVRIPLLLLSGIFLGSLVGTFLPRDVIARVLGKESGFSGILIALYSEPLYPVVHMFFFRFSPLFTRPAPGFHP